MTALLGLLEDANSHQPTKYPRTPWFLVSAIDMADFPHIPSSGGTTGVASHGEQLQTTTDVSGRHKRNRSSVDGTKYKDGRWSESNERILTGPYDYMLQHPGKDIRRQLIHAFNAWLKVPSESLAIINKVVAMLHTASLL